MSKYLLEIGVEELPYKFIPSACSQLKQAFEKLFKEERIEYSEINTYATPRRLVVIVDELKESQPDIIKTVKGPPAKIAYNEDGSMSKAGEGFLKKQGLKESDVSRIDEKGTEYLYAKVEQKGELTTHILGREIPSIVLKLQGSHFMRWADLNIKFSRPIRWIVSMYDREEVPVSIENIRSGVVSRGHRFSKNTEVKITSIEEYFDLLKKANVIVKQDERKEIIKKALENKVKEIDGVIKPDDSLLDEISNIVEWPVPVLCSFDKNYLDVPEDVTVTVMKAHQRYFPVYSKDGELMNHFVTVANYVGNEFENIKIGNERVIKARLDDGRFFYNEDSKIKLADRVEDLKGITFQKGLGNMYDKTLRLEKLSEYLAKNLGCEETQINYIKRCATLCKADLQTNLVYEFTELEGFIGADYALNSGEPVPVAQGIKEHYFPLGSDGKVAKSIEGQIVGIVDKIDTIVTTFAVGKKPTGSADPLGIRRATLGVISTILQNNLKIDLSDLILKSIEIAPIEIENKNALLVDIEEFFVGRFKILAQNQGYKYDVVDAVIDARNPLNDLFDAKYRLMVLTNLLDREDFGAFNEAANRIIRIIKDAQFDNLDIDASLFKQEAETQLYNCLNRIDGDNLTYEELIDGLFCLESKINKFFDDVLVMDKDEKIKHNRLILLETIKKKFIKIADFSKIVI